MLHARTRAIAAVTLIAVGLAPAIAAAAEPANQKFYEAYYREHALRDYNAAAELYANVLDDRSANRDVKAKAKARLAAVREELSATDFAQLMPPNALAYVELTRPGEQLMKLLDQLGILSDGQLPPVDGGRRIAVSPALIRESMGIRGAAAAITGFNPMKGEPNGVLVFHHGDLAVIRGLIETGLPAAANQVEPIGGFPTYDIEGQAFITLTSKLVVASTERSQINNAVRRLSGEVTSSLASTGLLDDYREHRDDSLAFFVINAKSVMPMISGMMHGGGHEMAAANAILDPNSLESIAGQIRVSDKGMALEMALKLDEGHHNLVYNFFRTPAVSKETLKCIPQGAAAFLVGALNETPSRFGSRSDAGSQNAQIVTALDIGREIFANITSFALFAAPLSDDASPSGPPIPDIGLVLTVNDPAKSEALWTQMLGIASLASGVGAIEGSSEEIGGVHVRSFEFPETFKAYYGNSGNDVIITSSRSAMARSIAAKRDGRSVLDDNAFRAGTSRINSATTKGLFVHAERCAKIAHRFMPPHDAAELAHFMNRLDDTVVSLVVDHSNDTLRLEAALSGIPQVGDLVAGMIDQELAQQESQRRIQHAMRDRDWDTAIDAVEKRLAANPGNTTALETKFRILATGSKNPELARKCASQLLDAIGDDATALNNFAWALLTEERYQGAFSEVALRFSKKSNELTHHKNWMFVDTLALASFETGDVQEAIGLERRAIELSGGPGVDEMEKALARFESAASESQLVSGEAKN